MRIRGIPELPEPSFLTHDDAWFSLDSLVERVCRVLDGTVSPLVAKCIIQMARHETHQWEKVEIGQLATEVCFALRSERIVVTPLTVKAVLMAYAGQVATLGVVQVVEDR